MNVHKTSIKYVSELVTILAGAADGRVQIPIVQPQLHHNGWTPEAKLYSGLKPFHGTEHLHQPTTNV